MMARRFLELCWLHALIFFIGAAACHAIIDAADGYVCMLDGANLSYGKVNILNRHFIASIVPLTTLRHHV